MKIQRYKLSMLAHHARPLRKPNPQRIYVGGNFVHAPGGVGIAERAGVTYLSGTWQPLRFIK